MWVGSVGHCLHGVAVPGLLQRSGNHESSKLIKAIIVDCSEIVTLKFCICCCGKESHVHLGLLEKRKRAKLTTKLLAWVWKTWDDAVLLSC